MSWNLKGPESEAQRSSAYGGGGGASKGILHLEGPGYEIKIAGTQLQHDD